MISVDRYTPGPSVILLVIASLAFLIPADFSMLINAFNFTSWFFKGLCIGSVIILRFTRPYKDHPRPYKVRLNLLFNTFLIQFSTLLITKKDAVYFIQQDYL